MKAESPETEIQKLMKEMGSTKGFDPIPPDQYLFFRNDADPEQRVLAVARARTIRQGYRRPFISDNQGLPLSLTELAKIVGMDPRNLTTTVKSLCTKGLLRVEKRPYRIMLCGKIDTKKEEIVNTVESMTYVKENHEKSWTPNDIPSYLLRQVQLWEKDRREKFFAWHKAWWEGSRKLLNETMAAVREQIIQDEDTGLLEFGLEKKRKPRDNPREETAKGNKKRTESKVMRQTPKNEVRHMTPSILLTEGVFTERTLSSSSSSKKVEDKSRAPALPTTTKIPQPHDPDAHQILEALQKYAPADLDAAQQLLDACHKETPTATCQSILEALNAKGAILNGRTRNRIGFLLTAVPKLFVPVVHRLHESIDQAEEHRTLRAQHNRDRMMAQEILKSPDAQPEDREWAERIVRQG